jgi:hypothetical protein
MESQKNFKMRSITQKMNVNIFSKDDHALKEKTKATTHRDASLQKIGHDHGSLPPFIDFLYAISYNVSL